jgi:magnesium-transporting ATPase (P-type)
MARRPLRCLAVAVKDTGLGALANVRPDAPYPRPAAATLQATDKFHQVEQGLTFVGMVGIKDPARPEVAGAIKRCRAAGIRVVMITGDSAPTASAISRDVSIFEESESLDGKVFVGGALAARSNLALA